MPSKQIKDAQSRLKELETQKKEFEYASFPESFIKDVNSEINNIKKFLAESTSASDLVCEVKDIVVEQAKEQALAVLDDFIQEHGNKTKTLVDVRTPSIPVASAGIASAVVSVGLKIEASLKSERKQNSIISEAGIDSRGSLRLGVELGFTAPVIGKIGIEGGIDGGATLTGKSTLTLTAQLPNLSASLNPAAIDLGLDAKLYLVLPDVTGVETLLELITDAISSMSSDGTTIFYKLGSINVVTITTPTYSIKFNVSNGRFHSPKAKGKFSASLNKKVKQKIDYVVQQIKYYAAQLNPVTHLSNARDAGEELVYDALVYLFD